VVGGSTYSGQMSKVDAMQAMREARYAARTADKTAMVSKPVAAAPRKKTTGETVAPAVVDDVQPHSGAEAGASTPEALCGHRSMNNRLCRRPAGHPEKNHRYH
jgi:hypothetical protein